MNSAPLQPCTPQPGKQWGARAAAVIVATATLAWTALALGAAPAPANGTGASGTGAGHPLVVTSDTSAYCRTLSAALDSRAPLPREVRELKAQGEGMCDQGQVRGGISQLRRALLVLNRSSQQGASDQ